MSWVVLIALLNGLLSLSGHVVGVEPVCREKRSACSCMTDQGLIDLSPLDSTTPNIPKFSNVDNPATNDTYFFNPCTPFSKTGTTSLSCNNVAVCHGWPKTGPTSYWDFGEHNTAVFQNDATTQKLQIKFNTNSGVSRWGVITLNCDRTEEGKLTFVSDFSGIAVLTLTSKYACPHDTEGSTTTKPACDNSENCTDASLLLWFAALFGVCVLLLTLLAISIAAVHCVRALSATKSDAAPFYNQQPGNFQYGTTAYFVPETVWSTKVPSNAFRKN